MGFSDGSSDVCSSDRTGGLSPRARAFRIQPLACVREREAPTASRRARRSPSPACGRGRRAAPGEGAPEPAPESCKGVIECGQHLRISALEISRHQIIHRLPPAPIRPPGTFPRKRGKGSRLSLTNENAPPCGPYSDRKRVVAEKRGSGTVK